MPTLKSTKGAELGLIIAPHISEKASVSTHADSDTRAQYVFRVLDRATKILLKKAVEERYAVKVYSVRILNTQDKIRRRGNVLGKKPGFKKAVVTLEKGQVIQEL